jgi:hypothetical protein
VGNPPSADPASTQNVVPLAGFLGGLNGDADEKIAWLESGVGREILGAADSELPDDATAKQRSGRIQKIIIARWRTYLKTDRPHRGAGERTRALERIAVLEAKERGRAPPADVNSIPPQMTRMFE